MDFAPAYKLAVTLPTGSFQLNTLITANTGLTTGIDLGGLDLTLADPTHDVAQVLSATRNGLPVSLNAPVSLQCRNIWGEWGTAWSGYISSAGAGYDPQYGLIYKITGADALKPFDVQTQSAGQVAALTRAQMTNVSASAVLQMAAQACLGGTWASKVNIDVAVDAGSGYQQSIPPATFISPQQSTWLAVLNGVAQYTGNILFADEKGVVQYRPVNYQAAPARYIPASVVNRFQMAASDQDVATHVEVRWGVLPVASAAPVAPTANTALASQLAAWDQQLYQRKFITYMPWLQNMQAASWVAQTLLQMGLAQIGIGQVTIIGDHAYHVGDTVQLGFLSPAQWGFIYSVSQQWQVGSSWLTTLGLTFCRDAGQSLPISSPPSSTALSGMPVVGQAVPSVAQTQANQLASGQAVQPIGFIMTATASKTAVPAGYDVVGSDQIYVTGSRTIIVDGSTNGPPTLGTTYPSTYTVYASATQGSDGLTIYDPAHAGQTEQVTATTVYVNQATAWTAPALPPPPAVQAVAATTAPATGTASGPGIYVPATQSGTTNTWRDAVMQVAASLYGKSYQFNDQIPTNPTSVAQVVSLSCAAFAYDCINLSSYLVHLIAKYGDSSGPMLSLAQGQYGLNTLANLPGATYPVVDWTQAQQGDLAFFYDPIYGPGYYDPTTRPGAANGLTYTHVSLVVGPYSGPAIRFNGSVAGTPYTLTTQMAVIGAENISQGVTYDDLVAGYWPAHLVLLERPDYS